MSSAQAPLTVSQLNSQIKFFLEQEVGPVLVEGELSNLSKPSSGHLYFTLKDRSAQIRCVFFKNYHFSSETIKLTEGQLIIAGGRLSLYEARGDYQLIVEKITYVGSGALFQQFEALKNKLSLEGLFLAHKKKPLPILPKTIGIISSPSGAALQDILSTLARRFPLIPVIIYPSEVQGAFAPKQLIKALLQAQAENRCDVLILARGGGSLEDLWAFNDEALARHISACTIPIVAGIGHETDFTIADFVSDLRAETPTAAATAITPNWQDTYQLLIQSEQALLAIMLQQFTILQTKLQHLMDKIASPKKAIATYWQHLDYLERQLLSAGFYSIQKKSHQLHLLTAKLQRHNPKTEITQTQIKATQLFNQLNQLMQTRIQQYTQRLHTYYATLHALSPLATLDRGYAIATSQDKILFDSQKVSIGEEIKVRLAKGELACRVHGKI